MVDNLDHLEKSGILNFINPGDCYMVQVLKRRKDNPDMLSNMEVLDNLFVYSVDDLKRKYDRIKLTCKTHNARAYIRINKRNDKTLALQTMVNIAKHIQLGEYHVVKNAYLSAAGTCNSEEVKKWIVDVDNIEDFGPIAVKISMLHRECNRNSNQAVYEIIATLKTKNGFHIITNPFNLQKFKQEFPNIDVHKDQPTILYTP